MVTVDRNNEIESKSKFRMELHIQFGHLNVFNVLYELAFGQSAHCSPKKFLCSQINSVLINYSCVHYDTI